MHWIRISADCTQKACEVDCVWSLPCLAEIWGQCEGCSCGHACWCRYVWKPQDTAGHTTGNRRTHHRKPQDTTGHLVKHLLPWYSSKSYTLLHYCKIYQLCYSTPVITSFITAGPDERPATRAVWRRKFLCSWSIHKTSSDLPCMAKPHHRATNRQILTVLGGFRKASVSTHSYGIWRWLDRGVSCGVLWCPAVSCGVSCGVLWCFVVSCSFLWCVLWCVLRCPVVFRHTRWCP